MPLYKSQIFFYLTVIFKFINFRFQIFLLYSLNVWQLHVLHCLDYPNCFGMDTVTTACQPASFDLKKPKHSSSNHDVWCFSSCRPRLYLAEVLIFSLMFSQALFMSQLSLKFSEAANLLEILFPNLQLNQLPEILSVHIRLLCGKVIYCQSFACFWNHQIVISITVSSPEKLHIVYT